MREQEISFETSKLAREKGFEATQKCYNSNGEPRTVSLVVRRIENFESEYYPRVNQALLQKWLREVHRLFVAVAIDINGKYYWYLLTTKGKVVKNPIHIKGFKHFEIYEEALEKGLQEALQLIEPATS